MSGGAPAAPVIPAPTAPAAWPWLDMALDIGAAAVTATLLVLVGLKAGGPGQVLLGLAFASFVPGWAILDWGPFDENAAKVTMAVVLSLTICTALALAQLWLGFWRPQLVFDVAAASALFAILAHLSREDVEQRRHGRTSVARS